jgi:hypothetical protein
MMNKDKQFLEDTLAFVRYIHNDENKSLSEKYFAIVGTLGHDLNGVLNEEPFFRPRVSGYSSLDNE